MSAKKELKLNPVSSQYEISMTESFHIEDLLNINDSLLKCGVPGIIDTIKSISGIGDASFSSNHNTIHLSILKDFDNDSFKASTLDLIIKYFKDSYIVGDNTKTYDYAVIVDEFTPHSPGLTTRDAIIEYCASRNIKIVGITGYHFIAKFQHSDYAQHMAIKKGKGGFCSDVYHVVEKSRADLLPTETIDF